MFVFAWAPWRAERSRVESSAWTLARPSCSSSSQGLVNPAPGSEEPIRYIVVDVVALYPLQRSFSVLEKNHEKFVKGYILSLCKVLLSGGRGGGWAMSGTWEWESNDMHDISPLLNLELLRLQPSVSVITINTTSNVMRTTYSTIAS